MKKKLALMLALVLVCVASLFTASVVYAADTDIIDNNYSCDKNAVFQNTAEGGIFYATGITHAEMIGFKFKEGQTLNSTDHTYVHMKGIVSENVNRIKLNGVYLFSLDDPSRGAITLGEDGVFEYHCAIAEATADGGKAYFDYDSPKMQFQMYVTSGEATLEMLGVVFNNSATYDGFATPQGGTDTPTPPTTDPDPITPPTTGTVTFGTMTASGDNATIEGNKATFTAAEENGVDSVEAGTLISIPVTGYDLTSHAYVSIKYRTTGVTSLGLHLNGTTADGETTGYVAHVAPADWNVTAINYASANFTIATATVDSYYDDYAFTAINAIVLKVTAEAGATLEILELAVTADGVHNFEVPAGEMEVGDIVVPSGAEVSKNSETGEQTVTYSTSPSWNTFDIAVTNYNSNLFIFEASFTASEEVAICFSINGTIDWSLDHKAYAGGVKNVQQIDVSEYNLPKDFTISMYIDAKVEVTAEKSIVFHSIGFKVPDPEPAGMYIAEPTGTAMNCFKAENGWNLAWNNNEASWRNVSFAVKNYDTAYDVLVIRMNATANTNIGIRVNYTMAVEGDIIETYGEVRNHYQPEGIVATTGDQELVYLFNAYNLTGKNIVGITIYFDNPTGTTVNTGDQTATIYSVEFLKSADQTFGELTITAPEKTADYTGEPIAIEATASANVALKVEYEVIGENGTASYTTSAPSNAGVYNVRVTYMGSLAYNYQVVTSKLTINKVKAVLAEGDVVIDAESRIITIAEGVVASTDEEFTEGFEVVSGDEIAYGTVIYYKRPADDNHTESESASLTFNRPETPSNSSQSSSTSTGATSSNGEGEQDGGCASSVSALGGSLAVALMGLAYAICKKRK